MKLKLSTVHKIVITLLVLIVSSTVLILLDLGYDYYSTGLQDRHFHPNHAEFKASGFVGHGLGVIGSLFMVIGVFSYMIRKRIHRFSRAGVLKYWLEFHIFLCTLGPFLILFHTTFKFGGIVAISFWSMVAVFLSGIIGRFIYVQIPHTIEGRELSLQELDDQQQEMKEQLKGLVSLNDDIYKSLDSIAETKAVTVAGFFWRSKAERIALKNLKNELRLMNVPLEKTKEVMQLFKDEMSLKKRIARLSTMHKLFEYWHVAHLPFALVMLVVMIIHVAVALTFGYKWIF